MSLTLSLAAAAWAPLRTMSQKVSPGDWWVTSAMVIRGVEALPAEAPSALSSDFLPPELLEQPASVRAAAAARATAGANLREREREERSIFPCTSLCDGENVGKGGGIYKTRQLALGRDPTPLVRPLSILC